MRSVSRSMAVAAVSALALTVSACGGGGGDEEPNENGAGATGGSIIVRGCEPEHKDWVPSNNNESCGADMIDPTLATLVNYDPDTAEPRNDIAESIESEDNQNFTVKIKSDYKWSDGSTVTAKDFVDAWNYTAYGPNVIGTSYFMAPIEGFDALQCSGPEDAEDPCAGAGAPKAKEMSGLKVVDDTTFTIKTTEKVSNLPVRVGYDAFAPLPPAFFEDPAAFAKAPVSAGPYKVTQSDPTSEVVMERNEHYSGEFDGKVDTITFKIYTDPAAAYQDLVAGNIDVSDEIPTDVLTDDVFKKDLEGRAATREVGIIGVVGMNPNVDKRLADVRVRRAISMAIDRQSVVDTIFAGQREPAKGWVSPVVDGFKDGACAEWCEFNPEEAKKLLEEAGGFEGKLTISSNTDSDHAPWIEAVCNSIRQTLGIECTIKGYPTFAEFQTDLGERKIEGLFRMGWVMDYPSIENFLAPLYQKGAESNYWDYDNPEFNQKLTEAAAADDLETANGLYQEAEAMLAEDMRVLPMWHYAINAGWSDKVDNVKIDAFGNPDLTQVTVK